MSEGNTLGLLGAYIGLVFLCALALMFSRWPRGLRALLVVATVGLYGLGAEVLDDVWGWPSRGSLPPKFVLLAAVTQEPTASQPGSIDLWVNAVDKGRPAAQPRAYRLPYEKDLHGLLNEALKRQREGVSQLGTATPKVGRGGLSWLRPGQDETQIKIRDMPAPQLPEK